jgi:UDP-N-acetylglucosamine--N-acetylmuramyl-(pentapeptide) pyrophosphoryl-undecaprenol N-acetylglucosamine transferase
MGGFVAGPGGVAAWLSRKPLLIHEQNAVAGTTNRLLSRLADRVFEAFPGSFTQARAETIGNPIRASIAAVGRARGAATHAATRHLLVFGGSQGAQALNRLLPEALARLDVKVRPLVRHQAGRQADETLQAYARAGVEAEVVEFIDDMAAAYAWADLVVGRAGALTVSELAAAGVGALLVPLPHAIDDHQTRNAEAFVAAGAGQLLPQSETDAARLARALEQCLNDQTLAAMSAAALAQARPDATTMLASACLDAAEKSR